MKRHLTTRLVLGLFFQILGAVALTGELSKGSPSIPGALMILLWLAIIVAGCVLVTAKRRSPVC